MSSNRPRIDSLVGVVENTQTGKPKCLCVTVSSGMTSKTLVDPAMKVQAAMSTSVPSGGWRPLKRGKLAWSIFTREVPQINDIAPSLSAGFKVSPIKTLNIQALVK